MNAEIKRVSTASVAALLLLILLVPADHAQSADQGTADELATARAEVRAMRARLDGWLLAAAEREDAIDIELKRRDAGMALLNTKLEHGAEEIEIARREADELRAQLADESSAASRTREMLQEQLLSARTMVKEHQGARTRQAPELEALRVDLDNARNESGQRQERVDAMSSELASIRESLEASRSELLMFKQNLDELTHANRNLKNELARSEDRLQTGGQESQDLSARLARISAERDAHATRADQAEDQLLTIADRHQNAVRDVRRMEAELMRIRAFVHPRDGGNATLLSARGMAAAAAGNYAQLISTPTADDQAKAELQQLTDEARSLMFARQMLVADLQGALGLYRVEPEDTLSRVAGRFLGDPGLWPELHELNRHALASPDELIPGMILIIPR